MSNFLKPFAFVKSFFVFGAAFFAMLSISCKQLASFDPVVDGNQTVVGSGGTTSETTEFAFNLKATHGLVRKISLEWTAFSGAKYYEIYFAESSSAEFVKIGETEQPFFDDAVGAGRTGYFKVCAVKANGASSPFSSTVVGTSLAVPIISDGEVGESNANISWSMENARGIDGTDYYEKTLKFEVVCQPKGGSDGETKVLSASSFSGSSYSCEFTNLSSSKDYEFYIKAYLESDTQNYETSPTVDKTTLTAYTPLAPKFLASEGDNAKGISLLITLPEMVTVKAFVKDSEIPNEKQDVPYPLCFEIYRKHEKAETYPEEPVGGITANGEKCKWYYNGTELTKTSVGYQEDGKPYEAGKQVVWLDDDTSLIGGEKYDYMIISVPDVSYSEVVCQDDKLFDNSENKRTPVDKATTAQGWKSAPPSFNVKTGEDGGRTLSADKTKVVSVSFGFSAEWNDLGKASDYKFAIKQNRTPWGSSSGTDSWLKNGETVYFDTLDAINSLVKIFGESGSLGENEKGSYSYTLYIVSKNDNGTEGIESESNVLDSMTARDRLVVTEEVNLPKAELAVQDGYKGKVVLKILTCEPGVTYSLERTKLVDGKASGEKTLPLSNVPGSGTFNYDDTDVENNCNYSYILKAETASKVFALSKAQTAETLGTPKVSFNSESLNYDSVKISFDDVLAAKSYVVKLGASGGFGGGNEFVFEPGFAGSKGNAEILLEGKTYTVTIKEPDGYDNATLAGMPADITVTAHSSVDKAASEAKQVNVLGPARLDAKVNTFENATEDSISLTWNAVKGAKGYLIRRVMYSDAGMTKVAENSAVTYYYEVASRKITTDGDDPDGRVTIEPSDASFKLTDIYKETSPNAEASVQNYQEAQAKIAWGLPFRYVVLPVLESSDFGFNGLELDGNGKVMYSNFDSTKTAATATFGYGLNLVAEKAMSGTTQNIKWEEPHVDKTGETVYTATKPVVYRRAAGTSDKFMRFTGQNNVVKDAKTGALTIDSKDYYDAFEYVVKYYPESESYYKEDFDLPPSLLEEIKKNTKEYNTPDANNPKVQELDNKGYLLTVDGFDAYVHPDTGKGNYYEQISWNQWVYTKRAVGPDSMIIRIQNNNIDASFHNLARIENANVSTDASIKDIADDVTAVKDGDPTKIRVAPAGIVAGTKGTTDGYLKVLRDYKHYYTFELKRSDGEKEITVSYEDYVGKDNSIKTAYRQITLDEFIDISAMSIGECLYNNSYSKVESVGKWSNDHTFTFKDDSPTFYKVSGTLETSGASTTEKPIAYGARRPMGTLDKSDTSTPCTLTLSSKDIVKDMIYDGKVTIDTMKAKSGKYTVEFNNNTKTLEGDDISRASQYFVFR
ncbi:MAG: hypothetical protein K2N58_07840 [Treponemataceae bacterium]|nr:hypothetical protein [Treponemataceae bacterium]